VAVRGRLDLLWGDEFTGPLGQVQSFSDDKGVGGNVPQGRGSHSLFGTVNEVAAAFLGQWVVPMSGEDTRLREKLIEHDRASVDVETTDGFDQG
jgi:hypothetical protein